MLQSSPPIVRKLLCAAVALLVGGANLAAAAPAAALTLPPIFSDNMILQRDAKVPVWGQATPGEKVTVRFLSQEKSATTDASGRWQVALDPLTANKEPAVLSIVTDSERRDFLNVLVGEVWLCSGQSNMQGTPKSLEVAEHIQDADNPQIRLFSVPRSGAGTWVPCTTDTARNFSAVGYYFGLNLWKALQIPVGVIVAAEGSSSIETWMPPESVAANKALVDQNGTKLTEEMAKFDRFFTGLDQLSVEEKERVLLEHCQSNYAFARSFLNPDGTLKPDSETGILWHLSVIKPAICFNKFIAPLAPFAIKGAVWYQGETNALGHDGQYALKQKALIEGWRARWNGAEMPFFLVQIPPYQSYTELPAFWRQQSLAARDTPRTVLVPAGDLGDVKDSHPKNKWDLGARVARFALKDIYGVADPGVPGPTYRSFTTKGNQVEVSFFHAEGGLMTKDGQPPEWFEVAGADKKFQKAPGVIAGDKVIMTSPMPEVKYVRCAWNYLAAPDLFNQAGIPVLPFTTEEEFFQAPP